MKVRLFPLIISLLLTALLTFLVVSWNKNSNLGALLPIGSILLVGATTIGMFAIKGDDLVQNTKLLSLIVFVISILDLFLFTRVFVGKNSFVPFVVVSGILLLLYSLAFYGIIRSAD